jgi:hypothetical protein
MSSLYQEKKERYGKARYLLLEENKGAKDAILSNNISKMEKIFKAGGIKNDAINLLIFWVKSLEMLKLFLRYGGDMQRVRM